MSQNKDEKEISLFEEDKSMYPVVYQRLHCDKKYDEALESNFTIVELYESKYVPVESYYKPISKLF